MPTRLGKAALYWLLAYWIVTLLGILLTVLFAAILHPPTPQELGLPVTQAPAYMMTLPFHPLLNLVVWPWFAWWYLRGLASTTPLGREAFRLGVFWVLATIVVDLFGWVLIPHIWRMTFAEFYIGYQPWITFIYIIILAVPPAVARLLQGTQLPQSAQS